MEQSVVAQCNYVFCRINLELEFALNFVLNESSHTINTISLRSLCKGIPRHI